MKTNIWSVTQVRPNLKARVKFRLTFNAVFMSSAGRQHTSPNVPVRSCLQFVSPNTRRILREATQPRKPAKSRSTSWSAGVSPSAPDTWGSSRNDQATALATVHAKRDAQRARQAISALRRSQFWSRALAFARRDRKFGRPRAPHLHSQHDKSRSSTPSDHFRVSSFLSSSGRKPSTTTSNLLASPGSKSRSRSRTRMLVVVHLPRDRSSRDTLHRESRSGQYLSPSARCAVTAMSIEEVATPASTHDQRKGHLETTEQEYSEQVRFQTCGAARWARNACDRTRALPDSESLGHTFTSR